MRDWLYTLKTIATTTDGQLSTPANMLQRAETAPRGIWWLAAKRHMAPGDRIWFYFTAPYAVIAAVAEVEDVPYEVQGDADYPWRLPAALDLAATRALNGNPVPLSALSNQHPQGVIGVRAADLKTLLRHAGM
ncbi:hypothetical protein ACIBCS_10070 [Streptomyces phaeochromogenes]|jgi:hypothetical protein|uniref:hypothetical protein n=1 Tax=Streptomyces phaeochromogenes TaxID=1923 RepID=UPI0033E4B4F4